ncbi:LysM peptidoglycan-binding domain-containing protein [Bacillus sp. HMF5848]|uniref:LysM peptidoglycan-binding domain-containing protein n=1 Tax=Bacillus sp. HMF5848 TaxID=2495421 RepID=UPI000F7ABE29|nr:LysM peptidoglycan-binding domain-containing protein [Bacillus sp. HMF5848]RSK27478.1 LysM peptidoglycan-binding domain-containing protein [Bacillus sp. HMF5848]
MSDKDQAERLRERVELVKGAEQTTELPPRADIHKKKENNKKVKLKVKYPIIRLLLLFFILLPISILAIKYYSSEQNVKTVNEPQLQSDNVYEAVNIDDKRDPKSEPDKEEAATPDVESQDEKTASEEVGQKIETEVSQEEEESTDNITSNQGSENTEAPAENTVKKTDIVYHTVQPKETLFSISMKYFNSKEGIEIIQENNNLKSNEIYVGQRLTIPLNK